MINQLELSESLGRRARAAYERIRDQTLWSAHPASFYHSVAQELMVLAEFGVARVAGMKTPDAYRVTTLRLEWRTADPRGGEKDVLVLLESALGGRLKKYKLATQVVVRERRHVISFEIGVKGKPRAPVLRKKRFKLVEAALSDLLLDLSAIFPREEESLFSLRLQDVIEAARKEAEEKYDRLRKRDVRVQVMLYHPGLRPDRERATATSADLGYLFYPVFEIPSGWSWLDCGHEHKGEIGGRSIAHSSEVSMLVPEQVPNGLTDPLRVLNWCLLAADEDQRNSCRVYLQQHLEEAVSLLRVAQDTPGVAGVGVDNAYARIASFILSFPPNHLLRELLPHSSNGLVEADAASSSPVVFQPRGNGPAGTVAKDLVTRLVRRVSAESTAAFSLRKDCLPYFLMGLLEAEWGVRADYSGIVTPLLGKGQLLGVLVAYSSREDGEEFNERDVELFESIAGYTGKIIQDAKENRFLHVMRTLWAEHFDRKGGENWKQAYDDWLRRLGKFLPFVLNVTAIWKWEVQPGSETLEPAGNEVALHRFMPAEQPTLFQKVESPIRSGEATTEARFVQWSPHLKDELAFCHTSDGMTDALLFLRALDPTGREPKIAETLLQLRLQSPGEVFLSHKENLEIWFNIVIGVVSADIYREEVQYGAAV